MEHIERIFVFGDSIQDNGNLCEKLNFPLSPFHDGRFCDGILASEYLRNRLEEENSEQKLELNNYAVGGALSSGKNPKNLFTNSSISVDHQIDQCLHKEKYLRDTDLVLLNGGANNFVFAIHDEVPYINVAAIYRVAKDLYMHANKVLSSGAGGVLLFNIPDITCAPFFEVLPLPNWFLNIYKKFVQYNIQKQNKKISNYIMELQNKYQEATIKEIDLYGLLNNVFLDPSPYGISNLMQPCVDSFGGVDADCNIQYDLELVNDPKESLFFDYVHPTSVAQKELSKLIYEKLYS